MEAHMKAGIFHRALAKNEIHRVRMLEFWEVGTLEYSTAQAGGGVSIPGCVSKSLAVALSAML